MNTCQNPLCNKVFQVKPGSLGKYCSLSCGTSHRNFLTREKQLKKYLDNPSICLFCKNTLSYDKKKYKFCSTSCSAKFNNAIKDYSKIKVGPKKGSKSKNYAPYTRIKPCTICSKFHKNQGKTCSPVCRSQEISKNVRGKTGGNRDLNKPGIDCDGKHFFFDSQWEVLLSDSLNQNNIYWKKPNRFILSNGRSYTPDFYLPDYDVYLDPKAKRPNYYRNSILKIEQFELEYNTKCLVISNKKFLSWGHIQTMLLVKNYRS